MDIYLGNLRKKIFSRYGKERWRIMGLGDVAQEIFTGSGITKEQLNTGECEAIKYIGKSTPLVITKGGDYVDVNLIERPRYCEWGDILFSKFNRIREVVGKIAVYLGEKRCLVGSGVIVLRHGQNPKYLAHVLSGSNVRKQMDSILRGSTVFHIYPKDLEKIQIPIPPPEIQRKIVEFLDVFSELEKELERGEMQYEHYRELLFNRGIGEKKWEMKTMEEMGSEIISGSEITREQLGRGEHPAVRAGDINGFLPLKFTECISFVDGEEIEDKRIFRNGDILMSNISNEVSNLGSASIYLGEGEGLAGVGVNIIRWRQNPKFLAYALSTEFVREEICGLAQRSTVYRLYPSTIKRIRIPLPPPDEQERMVEILDKLYGMSQMKGIPFLIQKYREQYEFYRDLLLEK